MLPGCFSFAHVPPDFHLSGQPVVLHPVVLGGQAAAISCVPTSHLIQQAVVQEQLRGPNVSTLLPLLCAINNGYANFGGSGVFAGTNSPVALNSASCVNPLLFCNLPNLHSIAVSGLSDSQTKDSDAHTIVRAPVLYNIPTAISDGQPSRQSTSRDSEQSPPDRIVASYAAAAHAAALVNHQPVSKAAENFLASTITRSRHSKRSRNHNMNPANRVTISDLNTVSTSTVRVPVSALPAHSRAVERQMGWSRIIDRKAMSVEYISPDGVHLHSRNEVFVYFRSKYSNFADGKQYGDLISSCFNFDPTIESTQFADESSLLSALRVDSVTTSPLIRESATFAEVEPEKSGSTLSRISFNSNVLDEKRSSAKRPRLSTSLTSNEATMNSTVEDRNRPSTISPLPSTISLGLEGVDVFLDACLRPQPGAFLQSSHFEFDMNRDGSEILATSVDSSRSLGIAATLPHFISDGISAQKVDVADSCTMPLTDIPGSCDRPLSSQSSADGTITGVSSVQLIEGVAAKMTTETLTTGSLNPSVPSCNPTVVPSVISPSLPNSVSDDIGLLALAGLTTSYPNLMHLPRASQNNSNNVLSLDHLIATSRLLQAQQQQQLVNYITALSTKLLTASQYPTLSAVPMLTANPHLTSLLLPSPPHSDSTWVSTTTWPEIASPGQTMSPTSLQQQLAVAAQQQIALTAMFQRQPTALSASQQQQSTLHPAAQLQSYLTTLQRQYPL